jgi:hypothetical protein
MTSTNRKEHREGKEATATIQTQMSARRRKEGSEIGVCEATVT